VPRVQPCVNHVGSVGKKKIPKKRGGGLFFPLKKKKKREVMMIRKYKRGNSVNVTERFGLGLQKKKGHREGQGRKKKKGGFDRMKWKKKRIGRKKSLIRPPVPNRSEKGKQPDREKRKGPFKPFVREKSTRTCSAAAQKKMKVGGRKGRGNLRFKVGGTRNCPVKKKTAKKNFPCTWGTTAQRG